jgi:hypothetical protein
MLPNGCHSATGNYLPESANHDPRSVTGSTADAARNADRARSGHRLSRTVATTAAQPAAAAGLLIGCDKTGVAFATARTGWLTGACASLDAAVLVTATAG